MKEELKKYEDDDFFLIEVINRARLGNVDEAKMILSDLPILIQNGQFDHPYFNYLSLALEEYNQGIALERAFGVEDVNVGGAPQKYGIELAAVDCILRFFCRFKKEASINYISDYILDNPGGKDLGKQIRSLRKLYSLNNLSLNQLLNLSGEYRQKVAEVLPENPL